MLASAKRLGLNQIQKVIFNKNNNCNEFNFKKTSIHIENSNTFPSCQFFWKFWETSLTVPHVCGEAVTKHFDLHLCNRWLFWNQDLQRGAQSGIEWSLTIGIHPTMVNLKPKLGEGCKTFLSIFLALIKGIWFWYFEDPGLVKDQTFLKLFLHPSLSRSINTCVMCTETLDTVEYVDKRTLRPTAPS